MAGTLAKARRRVEALGRLQDALGLDLSGLNAKGDRELLHIMHLERVADAVEEKRAEMEAEIEAETNVDLQTIVDRADKDQLTALAGVGKVTADRMMDGREERLSSGTPSDEN